MAADKEDGVFYPLRRNRRHGLLFFMQIRRLKLLRNLRFNVCAIPPPRQGEIFSPDSRRLRHSESVPKALCCGPSPWSLVPKPIPVLRPGQPTEHQLNHADPDLRLAGISQVFIILAVNPAPTQPAEGSLHHPPPRQQLKPSVPGKPADDLNHIPPVLRDPSVQGVIVVLGVRPQLPQARERFSRQLAEDLRCRRRIIHGRTGDGHG